MQEKIFRIYGRLGVSQTPNMFKKLKGITKVIFQTVNQINSSMGVQCVAPEKCGLRHTTSCDNCKNNIGEYEDKNFYEPR